MRPESEDTAETLHVAFGLTLLGIVVLAGIWAALNSHVVRHVEIRPHGETGGPPHFHRVEIQRREGQPLSLVARQDTETYATLRWPIPEAVPLAELESIRLVDARTNRIVDEVAVDGSSFQTERYDYELDTELSFAAALDQFFRLPVLTVILVTFGVFVLFAWISPGRDTWWFIRWWIPGN